MSAARMPPTSSLQANPEGVPHPRREVEETASGDRSEQPRCGDHHARCASAFLWPGLLRIISQNKPKLSWTRLVEPNPDLRGGPREFCQFQVQRRGGRPDDGLL